MFRVVFSNPYIWSAKPCSICPSIHLEFFLLWISLNYPQQLRDSLREFVPSLPFRFFVGVQVGSYSIVLFCLMLCYSLVDDSNFSVKGFDNFGFQKSICEAGIYRSENDFYLEAVFLTFLYVKYFQNRWCHILLLHYRVCIYFLKSWQFHFAAKRIRAKVYLNGWRTYNTFLQYIHVQIKYTQNECISNWTKFLYTEGVFIR